MSFLQYYRSGHKVNCMLTGGKAVRLKKDIGVDIFKHHVIINSKIIRYKNLEYFQHFYLMNPLDIPK